jgi:D-amino-acid dehydrogenase
MKIALIGAGIIGTCSALKLAEHGHHVTLFETNGSAAEEASFANAGVIAPGYVTPWAAPGMPRKVLRQLFQADAAVKFTPRFERAQWHWIARWLRACNPSTYAASRAALQQLAAHSLRQMHEWRNEFSFEYEQSQGYLQLLRSERDLQLIAPALDMLKANNHPHALIDRAQCLKLEPYLSSHTELHAAVHLPADEVGNCRFFAQQARDAAAALGADVRVRERVRSIEPQPGKGRISLQIQGSKELEHFDHVVVCAGVQSDVLLQPLGIHIPVLPVWGYSVSAAFRDIGASPFQAEISKIAGVMDERYKASITRLGNRIRVAGTAEIGAKPGEMNEAALETLYKVLQDWFPAIADLRQPQLWMGARPMLPDGPPVIGASKIKGLWLNMGHGSSGWALACGSADVLASLMRDKSADLDTAAFSPARYNA